jgi:hypothetical protein
VELWLGVGVGVGFGVDAFGLAEAEAEAEARGVEDALALGVGLYAVVLAELGETGATGALGKFGAVATWLGATLVIVGELFTVGATLELADADGVAEDVVEGCELRHSVGVGVGVALGLALGEAEVGLVVGHSSVGRPVGLAVGGITVTVTVGAGVVLLSVGNGSVTLGDPSFGFGWASVAVAVGFGVGFADELGLELGFGTAGLLGVGSCGLELTCVTVGSSLGVLVLALALGDAEVGVMLGSAALVDGLAP